MSDEQSIAAEILHRKVVEKAQKDFTNDADAAESLELACTVLGIPINEPPTGLDDVDDAAVGIIAAVDRWLLRDDAPS